MCSLSFQCSSTTYNVRSDGYPQYPRVAGSGLHGSCLRGRAIFCSHCCRCGFAATMRFGPHSLPYSYSYSPPTHQLCRVGVLPSALVWCNKMQAPETDEVLPRRGTMLSRQGKGTGSHHARVSIPAAGVIDDAAQLDAMDEISIHSNAIRRSLLAPR